MPTRLLLAASIVLGVTAACPAASVANGARNHVDFLDSKAVENAKR